MIRSHFGIERHPFDTEGLALLDHQQQIFDILRVHCQQGGLCLVLGVPGTGKSVLKAAISAHDPKRVIAPVVNRTLHSYFNTIRILSQSFGIDFDGADLRCEKRLIEEAFRLNHLHKMIAPIIDDAHLMGIDCLRKLRLLFEDFPKNHNLILFAQPELLARISLSVNADIQSRVTYSAMLPKLVPDDIAAFVLAQLDRCGLGHNTFTEAAINLVARSSEGILRRARNLCLSALIEAVRDRTRTVDLPQINRVLIQPHWRLEHDLVQG